MLLKLNPKQFYHVSICLLLFLLFLGSCRKELDTEKWETELLIPLASTSLNIQNLVGEANIEENDEVLNLVYNYDLYSARGTDFLIVPDTTLKYSMNLETIKLSNNALSASISLGEMQPALKFFNGQSVVIPPQSVNNTPDFDVDATSFFETATLKGGKMYIKIRNELPVNIAYARFKLLNKSDESEVGDMEFFNINTNSTVEDSLDMAGKYVEGEMLGRLTEIRTDASDGAVVINTDDAVFINIRVKDLSAESATAIFPAQNLLDIDRNIVYKFGEPRITKMKVKSGELRVKLESTIDETIYVTFKSPGLSKDGETVLEYFTIPPSTSANPFSEERVLQLAGYDADFRGKAHEGHINKNMLHNLITARIDSSGVMKSLSLADSISIEYGLYDIVPEYVEGYLGSYNEQIISELVAIDAFDKVDGVLDLENASLAIFINNGVGIAAEIELFDLISNGKNGDVLLTSQSLSQPLQLQKATNNPLKIAENVIKLNNTNSNMTEFIEAFPQSITYSLNINLNKNGNDETYSDFAYYESPIAAGVNLTVPLKFKTENLTITDKVVFNLSEIDLGRINEAEFYLISDNSFSFSLDPVVVLYDADNQVIDTLFSNVEWIEPGSAKEFGKELEATRTVLKLPASKEQLNKWQLATKAEIIANIHTGNQTNYITIFKQSKIDFTLSAKFSYEQEISK